MSISIQIYSNTDIRDASAFQVAVDLHTSLIRPSILQSLSDAGVSVHDIGPVQDISFVEESEYEQRSSFEILIGVAENVEDQPGSIETVEPLTGTFTK